MFMLAYISYTNETNYGEVHLISAYILTPKMKFVISISIEINLCNFMPMGAGIVQLV
jgi:hypothetical protein